MTTVDVHESPSRLHAVADSTGVRALQLLTAEASDVDG
jgi:hypothetical protein